MSNSEPTYEELKVRLGQIEEALHRCEKTSIANQFVAVVLHEVNNPLEAIINLAYLLGCEKGLSDAGREYLASLDGQLAVLTHVTQTSLSFVRDQAEAKDIDLVLIAQASLKLHYARLKRDEIRVQTRFAERAVSSVIASEIMQVFSNLMLNAMDALPGVSTPTLHMRVHHRRHGIHITVADNGASIPKEIEQTLFQPNITGKRSGTGIGLWLSKRLVSKHSGRMSYRTWRTQGKSGTVFRVWFPHANVA